MANKFRKGDKVSTSLGSISDVAGVNVLYTLSDGSVWNEHSLKLIRHTPNDDELFIALCAAIDANPLVLKSTTRLHDAVWKRHAIMYILHKMYNWSFEKIGQILNRNHSTAIHACHNVETMLYIKDKEMIQLIKKLNEI